MPQLPQTEITDTLAEHARRFLALYDRTLLGIYVIDLNGIIVDLNQTASQQLGSTIEELRGKPFDQLLADELTHNRAQERIARLINENASGEPMELRMRKKDGGITWLEMESSVLVDETTPYGIIGVALDITDRKKSELREKHLLDVSSAVHNINQLIVRERDRHVLIDKACDIMTQVPEYQSMWIVLTDSNRDPLDFASSGRLSDGDAFVQDMQVSPHPACIRKALDQSEVVVVDKSSRENFCSSCSFVCKSPDEMKMIISISAGEQLEGIMGVSLSGEFLIHEQEKALFAEAASDIGFGLYRMRLEEAEHRAHMEQLKQREFLDLALESSGMGEWEMNIRTGELRWGERLKQIFGINPEEFEGTVESFQKRVHPKWRQRLLEEISSYFQSASVGAEYQAEYPIIHSSGQTRWLQSRGRMIGGADAGPEKIIGLSWDITDRKLKEEALRISEERYRTFMRETVEGIYLITFSEPIPVSLPVEHQVQLFYQRARIVEANDAFAQMYGYSSSDLGNLSLEVFHGGTSKKENLEFLGDFVNKNYRLANAVSHEIDHEGEEKVFLNNLFGIVKNGELLRVWGTQQDITELSRAEEDIRKQAKELAEANISLSEANRRLRELDKLKSEFVSMASHELRTPITSILGFAQTLTEPDFDLTENEKKAYISIIQKETKRLGILVSDLLDLTRIEVGKAAERVEPVSLEGLVREVIESMRIPSRIDIRIFSSEQGRLPFRCNSDAIKRVFLNLIDNALKFADQIEICIDGSPEERKVAVCDNGPGIPAQYRQKIFEKFYRVQSEKQSPEGSGLGLSMVKDIVEMHDGNIWVESQPGKGAEFHFTLKARK